jgi:hypothetical protein
VYLCVCGPCVSSKTKNNRVSICESLHVWSVCVQVSSKTKKVSFLINMSVQEFEKPDCLERSPETVDFRPLASFFPKIRESASHFFNGCNKTTYYYVRFLVFAQVSEISSKSHRVSWDLLWDLSAKKDRSPSCKSRETAAAATQQQQQHSGGGSDTTKQHNGRRQRHNISSTMGGGGSNIHQRSYNRAAAREWSSKNLKSNEISSSLMRSHRVSSKWHEISAQARGSHKDIQYLPSM